MRFFLILLLLSPFAVGCATSGSGALEGAVDADLVGLTWQLTTMDAPPPAGPEATITFHSDGRVSGTTGCNRFTGTYEQAADGSLSFSPLATTRMACPPPAGEQERRVLDALAATERADVEGGRLLLLDANGRRLLTFEASTSAASATLSGTVAYLPRIALPPDAVVTVRLLDVSLADAPSVTLAEQTISVEGRSVPIPFAVSYDPSEIQPRRRYVVRADIRSASGELLWTTDTAYPVLTSGAPADGIEVRVVQVAGADETGALVGPDWRLVEIESSGLVITPGGEPYTITFGPDGRYSGQAACNRYGGTFETGADGALRLGQSLSTLAACPPPSVSADYFRVLNGAESYALTGDRLRVISSEGTLMFQRESQGELLPQETGRGYSYTCESSEGPFTFRIRTGPGEVALWLPERFAGREGGTYRVLGQVRSASGARYRDGPVTVWTHAGEARLDVDGQTFSGCRS